MLNEQTDQQILDSVPDFLCFGGMLKASPAEERGERILYLEASNEDTDHQNEIVLQKALQDSSDYFLRHGNIDLSHYSIMGHKAGIANHLEYEIGKPLEVRVDGHRTMVKAQLYQGDSPTVWESLTKQSPPARWFPSVGGAVLAKAIKIDPKTREKVAVIERVRWNNIALDRCPVNKTVPEASLAPVGVFVKSLGGFVLKALEASHSTDVASLTGGGALGMQSLDGGGAPKSYFDFRNRLAEAMRNGKAGGNPGMQDLIDLAVRNFGMPLNSAAEWVERFARDLKTGLKRRRQANG
jgi:hypothetical protein